MTHAVHRVNEVKIMHTDHTRFFQTTINKLKFNIKNGSQRRTYNCVNVSAKSSSSAVQTWYPHGYDKKVFGSTTCLSNTTW